MTMRTGAQPAIAAAVAARSQAPAARIGSAGGNAAIARFIRAGAPMVQRDGPAAVTPAPAAVPAPAAPAPAPGAAPAPSPEAARQLAYQATVLRDVPELTHAHREVLGRVLAGFPVYEQLLQRDEKRRELDGLHQTLTDFEHRNQALARGEELSGGAGSSPEQMRRLHDDAERLTREIGRLSTQIAPLLQELGTDEAGLRRRVEEEFPRIWLAQARVIATTMLGENEQAVQRERARYRSGVCSEGTEALLATDRRLLALDREHEDLARQRAEADDRLRPGGEALPGGMAEGPEETQRDQDRIRQLDERIGANETRRRAERETNGLAFPILLSAAYVPGSLQDLPPGQLEQRLGTWTERTLENIRATRANIADGTLKLWDLRDVPELTWVALGLPADGPLARVIANHRARERSRQEAVDTAIAALSITAGVVAGVATAGGAVLVAAAATGMSAGAGLVQLGRDVNRYRAESAASGVAVDPALADLSRNEPELLPIVMDLVGLGTDAAGAVGLARRAMQAQRTLLAAGRMAECADEIRRIVGNEAVAGRIVQRAAQGAEVAGQVERAAALTATTVRSAGNLRLAQLALQLAGEESVFAEWAARLLAEGRATLATEAAIRARFANPAELTTALESLAAMTAANADGWFEPSLRHLFVFALDQHTMSAALVHEATHFLQRANGRRVINFLAEFQAFAAQRDYLLGVARTAGRGAIPPGMLHLIDEDLPTMARTISARYQAAFPHLAAQYAIPAGFNADDELHALALMVTTALSP